MSATAQNTAVAVINWIETSFASCTMAHVNAMNQLIRHAVWSGLRLIHVPMGTDSVGSADLAGWFVGCGVAGGLVHALQVVDIAVKTLAVEAVIIVFHMSDLLFML